ncbi:MAG: ribonuclease T [Pseudomonadales bacterium]|nr:ribonuclease T [Pseudomonadales bacterium]
MELKERFRGYLPVVIDFETGGFDADQNPLLEVACSFLGWRDTHLFVSETHSWDVEPYPGLTIDPASLKVTGIDLDSRSDSVADEKVVMSEFFKLVRSQMKAVGCHRAVMVAHNAAFDAGFLSAVLKRQNMKRNPFHPFTTIDTATLGAVAFGHTVLSEICQRAGIEFDRDLAHSAKYDAERTAQVFCEIVNTWPLNTDSWKKEGVPSA